MRQLKELFIQIDEGVITREAVTEFLKRGRFMGFSELFISAIDAARASAKKIYDESWQGRAWAEISQATSEVADLEKARELALKESKICGGKLGFSGGEIFARIVQVLISAKKTEEARKTTLEIGYPYWHNFALAEIAKATGNAEDWQAVRQTVSKITDIDWLCSALINLASATREPNDIEAAREKINGLSDSDLSRKSGFLIDFAQVTGAEDDFEIARQISQKIEDPYWRKNALAKIAVITHNEKDIEAARQVSLKHLDFYSQLPILTSIAKASGKTDDFEVAREVAARVTPQSSSAWLYMCWVYLDVGNIEAAKEATQRISDSSTRSYALEGIVKKLVKNENFEAAQQSAEKISDPIHRSIAFASIAQGLVKKIKI